MVPISTTKGKDKLMKDFFRKIIKEYIFNHKIQSHNIKENKNYCLSFKDLKPFVRRKLVLKDRGTGRKIQIDIRGKKCEFLLEDIFEVNQNGTFDTYIKFSIWKKKWLKKIELNKTINLFEYFDQKNKTIIRFFKTKNNQLAFITKKISFKTTISKLNNVGSNFYILGTIEPLESFFPEIAEIVIQRRDNKKSIGYKCELHKNVENDQYTFSCVLVLDKLRDYLAINSRWDIFLQLRDTSKKVIYRELINFEDNGAFEKEENRYVVNVRDKSYIVSLYVTMGKHSLALWYTDEAQFKRTYNIARGKSKYNEICENEKIDEKMVFFESFLGKNYSGNPKYIYEEMLRNNKFNNYKFVWSYSGESPNEIPGNPIIVNREDEKYYEYLARSKYWVNNILFPVHRKREGNKYIQTWHGTPLKKLGFDIEIEGPEVLARENFYLESRNWDYLISANEYSSKIFRRAFKYKKDILEFGYPANDIFYQEEFKKKTKGLRKKLGIPKNKKVILYAPTWRDNKSVNSWEHSFSLKFDIDKFYKHLKDEYVLILRMHHLIAESIEIDKKHERFVYDLSKYDDIQELYMLSDILVTDYSSVFFDFANSKKPILFFAYDFEEYKYNVRGFYLDMEKDLPGPIINNENELLDSIKNIDLVIASYKTKYEDFYNSFCKLEKGNASKEVINKVFKM